MSKHDIIEMGFRRGDALKLMAKLFPVAAVQATATVLTESLQGNGRPPERAREFPELKGSSGLPTARGLKAWMPGVLDVLERRGVNVNELVEIQRDPRSELDPAWLHGGAQDKALWSVLAGCGDKGLPAEIMLSFPASVRDGRQGLRAWQHLFRRVLLVTDESIAALQTWFDSPPAVKKRGDLLTALNNWKNVVEELEVAGCPPWGPARRQSLTRMCSSIPEAGAVVTALKAIDKLEVEALYSGLERLGIDFASQQQQQQALGVFTQQQQPQQHRQQKVGRCWHWEAGTCMRGDGCRYSHDGEAGSAPRRRPQHLAAAAVVVPASTADKPIDQIKAEIAALQRFVAASTADKNKWCAYSCNNQFAVLENCHDNDNYPTEKPGGIGSPIQVSIYSRPETCESESVMPSQTPLVIVNQSGGGVLVDSTARCDSVEAGGPIACLGDTYHTKLPYSNPIVDSGATISMLGQDLMPHVVNRELLDRPIEVVTANDSIILTHQGDIPGDNPMKQAVINEASAKSLLSLRELCIRYNAGFEVGPGYINPKLVRDGVTVKDLIINNNLIEFPLNVEGI